MSDADDIDDLVAETARRIFEDFGQPQDIIHAMKTGDDGWRAPLWSALEEAGLTRAWVPEALGGAGVPVSSAFAILRQAGAFAVAVPLAETLIAGWALSRAGLETPPGPLTVAAGQLTVDAGGIVQGSVDAVPFARLSDHVVLVNDTTVALVRREDCALHEGVSMAGDPADTLSFDGVTAIGYAEFTGGAEAVRRVGATVRAMQMAGALEALLVMSTDYAKERIAFGRPIAKFQAVQHLLARLGEETAAAVAAAVSATRAVENLPVDGEPCFIEIAVAKVRAGEAADAGAMIAHEVHAAIGFTDEHPLHRYAQRLWSWRDDFGAEAEWAAGLGAIFCRNGGDGFWPALTAV